MCRVSRSQTGEPASSSGEHKPMSAKIALALHNVMTKVTYVQKGSEINFMAISMFQKPTCLRSCGQP